MTSTIQNIDHNLCTLLKTDNIVASVFKCEHFTFISAEKVTSIWPLTESHIMSWIQTHIYKGQVIKVSVTDKSEYAENHLFNGYISLTFLKTICSMVIFHWLSENLPSMVIFHWLFWKPSIHWLYFSWAFLKTICSLVIFHAHKVLNFGTEWVYKH